MTIGRNEFLLKGMKCFTVKYLEKRSDLWQKNDNPGGKPQS